MNMTRWWCLLKYHLNDRGFSTAALYAEGLCVPEGDLCAVGLCVPVMTSTAKPSAGTLAGTFAGTLAVTVAGTFAGTSGSSLAIPGHTSTGTLGK